MWCPFVKYVSTTLVSFLQHMAIAIYAPRDNDSPKNIFSFVCFISVLCFISGLFLCLTFLLYSFFASRFFLCQIFVFFPSRFFLCQLLMLCFFNQIVPFADLCFILMLCFCNQIVHLSDLCFILMLCFCNHIVHLSDLCFILMLCFCNQIVPLSGLCFILMLCFSFVRPLFYLDVVFL